jgi:hypothetical protein
MKGSSREVEGMIFDDCACLASAEVYRILEEIIFNIRSVS